MILFHFDIVNSGERYFMGSDMCMLESPLLWCRKDPNDRNESQRKVLLTTQNVSNKWIKYLCLRYQGVYINGRSKLHRTQKSLPEFLCTYYEPYIVSDRLYFLINLDRPSFLKRSQVLLIKTIYEGFD